MTKDAERSGAVVPVAVWKCGKEAGSGVEQCEPDRAEQRNGGDRHRAVGRRPPEPGPERPIIGRDALRLMREITVSRALALSYDIGKNGYEGDAGGPAQSLADSAAVRVADVCGPVTAMADNVCASSRNGCPLAARKGLQGRRQGRV